MDTSWMKLGKCREEKTPNSFFFPNDYVSGRYGISIEELEEQATEFCTGCSVKAECLRYALELDLEGVFGGTSTKGRKRMSLRKKNSFTTRNTVAS